MYNAYVTRIKNLHKHPNADRLQIGECFGNNVIVSLDYKDNQLGIYFPSDGQLDTKFADKNNLLRKKDENGNNVGGYMNPDKRNVTAIKLRGEKSDGLFLPLESLASFGDIKTLSDGDVITTFNGNEICRKYIPHTNYKRDGETEGNKTRKKKIKHIDVAPLFVEHADTEQLAYNLSAFKPGDEVEITLKMHGTSQRTGYLPVFKEYKRSILDRMLHRDGTPIYDWGYVTGTRRTVLNDYEGGFYGSNAFREQHAKFFEGKLWAGEEIYYEVVGFTDTGAPIMGDASNKKLNDKEFVKQYGETTRFSYGCCPSGNEPKIDADENENGDLPTLSQSDFYVYRMTMTNKDGNMVEYNPDFMRYRCEQMGCKCVQAFEKFIIPENLPVVYDMSTETDYQMTAGDYVKEKAEQYYDGPDPVGKTHVREGVVCRIINRPKFCAYKHKNWYFKALEGIVKVDETTPDMEEAQEVIEHTTK